MRWPLFAGKRRLQKVLDVVYVQLLMGCLAPKEIHGRGESRPAPMPTLVGLEGDGERPGTDMDRRLCTTLKT